MMSLAVIFTRLSVDVVNHAQRGAAGTKSQVLDRLAMRARMISSMAWSFRSRSMASRKGLRTGRPHGLALLPGGKDGAPSG